jgi:pilus assembly protein TadC
MDFNIPFTFSSIDILRKKSKGFSLFRARKDSKMEDYLKNANCDLTASEYMGICLRTFAIFFIIFLAIASTVMAILKINYFYFYSLGIAFIFSGFLFFSQFNYPKVYSGRKTREIEKNLISAMQDMLVQLESGVPIFQIISNIATSDYGFVSSEFRMAVKEINSGVSQVDALENLIKRSNSVYFKRVLWQISNGLRSGSDMSIVMKDSIDNLGKEQAIQIQAYGSKLNPLIMFYMLISVIMPALGITFFTIISSMLGLAGNIIQLMYIAIFVFVILIQIMFLGMIKSRRPSLL